MSRLRRRKEEDAAWRDPAEVVAAWPAAGAIDRRLLAHRATGEWWDLLAERRLTLLVTREYEHLVIALAGDGRRVTYLPLPHPSGLVVDRERHRVHVAATRNPNQILTLAPAASRPDRPLLPIASRFLPGRLYLHDLALVGGVLHANAVGENAVVRLDPDGSTERVWWPRSIEASGRPLFEANVLQLNSIAAGPSVEASYFTASAAAPGERRPGDADFEVDGRGVVFDGRTRQPLVGGLTRPHSARLHRRRLLVLDSGYGRLIRIRRGEVVEIVGLPGWTRGLAVHGDLAFVGTSRVLPRFTRYAPGLDLDRSVCAVHAVDLATGRVRGSLRWPDGNQIFAIDHLPASLSGGLPFAAAGRRRDERDLFHDYSIDPRSRP